MRGSSLFLFVTGIASALLVSFVLPMIPIKLNKITSVLAQGVAVLLAGMLVKQLRLA